MTKSFLDDQVTDTQLTQYARLIYEKTGIRVSPKKKLLLSNRLRRRLRKTGISSFANYLKHLGKLPAGNSEWDAFLQEITTHETYLFRDEGQWDWFRDSFLFQISSEAREGLRKKSLRIWSAACSTGDESYTIAACIADRLLNCSQWDICILGTDIGVGALKSAQAATFGERAMRNVSVSYRRRFFTKARDGKAWTAYPALSRWIRFRQHNLLEPLKELPFDLIFLKNVLIYFDVDSKKKVLQQIRPLLGPGGILVTGAAEGASEMLKDLKTSNGWMFRKPSSSGNRRIQIRRKQ